MRPPNSPDKLTRSPAHSPMKTLARIIAVLGLLAIAGFCGFGFQATFELSEARSRLPWQIGYTTLGLVCVVGMVALVRPRRDRTSSP